LIKGVGLTIENNLGIGTATPLSKLHILDNTVGAYTLMGNDYLILENNGDNFINIIGGANNNIGLRFGDSIDVDESWIAYNSGVQKLIFGLSGNDIMRISSSNIEFYGNVGVGNATPSYKLDVNGTGRFVGNVDMSAGLDITGNLTVGTSDFFVNDSTGNVGIGNAAPSYKLDVNGTGKFIGNVDMSAGLDITGNLTVGTSDFFVNDSTGNVGIGNAAPSYKLDVNGTGRFVGNVDMSAGLDITGNLTVGASDFFVNDSTGRVGIGTATPSESLEVNGRIKDKSGYIAPVGTINMFAGSSAPTGWLLCNGAAISRTTYSDLFTVIGTTYGSGDGSTTFNLPNLKGKFPVGYNTGETEFNSLGKTGGEKTHVLTATEMPSHTHIVNFRYDSYTMDNGSYTNHNVIENVGSGSSHNLTSTSAGSNAAHNNLPPYFTTNFIIKW
jgi:microcystin-dependent protein